MKRRLCKERVAAFAPMCLLVTNAIFACIRMLQTALAQSRFLVYGRRLLPSRSFPLFAGRLSFGIFRFQHLRDPFLCIAYQLAQGNLHE